MVALGRPGGPHGTPCPPSLLLLSPAQAALTASRPEKQNKIAGLVTCSSKAKDPRVTGDRGQSPDPAGEAHA